MFIVARKAKRGSQFTGAPTNPSTSPPQTLYSDTSRHTRDQESWRWSEIHEFIAKENPYDNPKVMVFMYEIKKNKDDEKE